MPHSETIEFALDGTIAGQRISATDGVPFTRFLEFNEDVQKYIQGSDGHSVLRDLKVQVREGSYLLNVLIPAGLLPSLAADSGKLSGKAAIDDVDPVRAKIVLKWQERARSEPTLVFAVRSPTGAFAPLVITKDSFIRSEAKSSWVQVERYLIGEITDWGGAQRPNIHLRPRNTRDTLIVDASAEQIRAQRDNLVFHKAIVHVRAKQNPKTGEMKDYRLLDLRAYKPEVSEEKLLMLFEKGAKAWAGIPDTGRWVDELRGGANG